MLIFYVYCTNPTILMMFLRFGMIPIYSWQRLLDILYYGGEGSCRCAPPHGSLLRTQEKRMKCAGNNASNVGYACMEVFIRQGI